MPLDSLGLGLTLDTTLLEKADKTLENMHKNSKLIMQNLTRGISAFDDGKINNFSSTIKHISDSLDKISKTSVSPDFDTRGLAKGVGYVTELVSEIEKMQKAGTKQFFNTDALYTTKVSVTETAMALKNLRDEADRVDTAIRVFLQFPDLIDASKKRVQELRDELKSINKKQNPEQYAATTVELDVERKKLQGLKDTLAEVKKEYGNLNNARLKSKQIIEQIAIAEDLHSWTSKTKAEQLAAITSYNNKIIAEERARTKEVETLYKNNFAEMQKISKSIAQLEADREKIAKGGGDTTEQDMNLAFYRDQLQKRRDLEVEIASSGYQKIAKIKKELNAEAFLDESKQQVKNLETEVAFANKFSKNAKSINEEKEAIKLLTAARDNLSSSTAHYDSVVNSLNKRIAKHEDHVKLLTQEQKESKELQDSVISRYIRERKEIDKLDKSLDELAQKQSSTGVKTADEDNYEKALKDRRARLAKDIQEIETNNAKHIAQLQEKYDASVAEEKIAEVIKQNEREKQEYAKLLDDLYAIEKQKKSMEAAGGGVGDAAYDKLLQQENDLNSRKSQLEAQHQNDLDEIRKEHDKKRNNDEVKAFIDAQKDKQRIAEETQKKIDAYNEKYGTVSKQGAEIAIKSYDNAKNVAQHKQAIEDLQRVRAKLDSSDKDYLKTVKELNDAIKWHQIEVEIADDKSKGLMQTHRGLMDIGGQLMRRLALVFSVSQLTQYFRKLVEVRGEFEKQEVALKTLLKSKYQANILMQQVTDLAVKSPFTLQQLIGYTKQLAAYQIEYKKLYSTTKMLADVSAGLGVEMDRLILAFGQVRAANFLRATEVRQFTEAGMDILGELAKYYSKLEGKMVSVADVQERVTKRMVGFSDVEEVFKRVTSAGGIFYDMQAKQAETLSGQWSNLQDKIGIMFNEIGKGTDGLLKGIVRFLASIVDNWEKASTVLTALVGSFVAVKINTALASKELIKFVRTMGLIKGRVKSVSILQTLGAVFVKLGKSIKSAALAMKGFAVSHPIITALILLATLIGKVYKEWNRQEEAAKKVRKQYDELSESVEKLTVAFNRMGREGDFEGQKKQLEELVTLANNEYQMNIKVNLEGTTAEEVTQQFIELQQKMLLLNSFATDFNTDYAQSGKQTEKSMKKYGEVAKETLKSLVQDAERVAFTLDKLESEGVKLTDSQVEARNKLAEPRQINESELDYLQRLMTAFDLLTYEYENMEEERVRALQGLDFDSEEYTKTAMDFTRSLIDIQGRMSEMGLSVGDITKIYSKYNKAQGDAIRKYNEFLDMVEVPSFLTDEGKEERIKFAIDTYAAQNQWDEFMINLAYDLANKKFVINITPEVDLPSDDKLEAWQKTYNEKFAKYEGFTKIGKSDTTQSHQIDILNDAFKKQEELVKQIEKVGTEGAYQGYKLADEQKKLAQIVAQLNWFGIDPKTKGKDEVLEKLKNRINLIKEMNKEYEKLNETESKEEALEKVRKAYTDTAKELELDISTMDFTDAGTISSLEKLLGDPKYEANEYAIELKKALDGLKAELNLEVDERHRQRILDEVQDIFDKYELSIELKKLNIPNDVAQNLFGVETKTFEQMRNEIIAKFAGGSKEAQDILTKGILSAEDATKLAEIIGTKQVEEARKAIEKIDDLEEKQQLESAKRFAKFLTQNLDQTRVVLQQRGIDIAFAKKEFDEGRISAEQFAETVKNIVAQSNEEISKFNLDKFKESAEYIQAMGDLSSYSKKEIQALIKTLNDAVTQNAHLFDADEVKAYMDALKKAQEEIESRDVFKWGDFERAADIIQTQRDIEDKKADIETNKAELETQKQKLAELQAKLDNLKAQQKATKDAGGDTTQVDADIAKTTSDIVTANEEIGKTNNEIKTNTGLLSLLGDKMKGLAGNMGSTFSIIDAIVHGINDTVQGINTIYGEIGSVMESFGKETDFSTGFGKGAMLMDTFAKSSQAAADGWDAFKSGDPVGVVVNVVKSITEIIKGINAYHDAGLEVSIQDHLEEVERLQKEYEKLEWVIGRAFAFDKYGMVAEQTKNIGKQIENTSKAIALEEDKKDTDEERIKELRENAEDARRQIHELYDNLREEIVGSYEDLSSTLADAMIEALKNGEDALKAWGDEVDNIIANIATKLAVQKYVEPQVSNVLDQFYNKVMPKNAAAEKAFTRLQSMTVGTKEYENALAEWEKLNSEAIGELPQLTESSVNALKDSLNAVGVSFEPIAEQIASIFSGQGGGLSALQKGIQGITEDTAQIIEAYLNSIRAYTSEQVEYTKKIYNMFYAMTMGTANGLNVRLIP